MTRIYEDKIPMYPNIIIDGYSWLRDNGFSAKYTDKYRFYKNGDEVSWDVLVTAVAKEFEGYAREHKVDEYGYLMNWFKFPKNYSAIKDFLMPLPGLEQDKNL